ncbi:GNAT family N-acetyltransferase [Halodurantibacterium flavum]|uniref:GNAT family N-acetyltransferase n=1 Tax=Halodurantibacterium flavum TaxID=1382802 RepID=A0ABW4S259_9RHOB
MSKVVDNPAQKRFELPIDGSDGEIAAAYYRVEDGGLVLVHTEVPYQFSGEGLGSQLARGVFDEVRARGGKVILRCSFMGSFYARHPEYSDIVSG